MKKQFNLIVLVLVLCAATAKAEFAVETETGDGVVDASDFSWRNYLDEMNRFPDRLGIICYNAYILNKTPDHKAAFAFFTECAKRGNEPSMINLAQFYAEGMGVDKDLAKSTDLLRQAAFRGYPAAELEYGKALFVGEGVTPNEELGRYWIAMAAKHGDEDAQKLLAMPDLNLGPMTQ